MDKIFIIINLFDNIEVRYYIIKLYPNFPIINYNYNIYSKNNLIINS